MLALVNFLYVVFFSIALADDETDRVEAVLCSASPQQYDQHLVWKIADLEMDKSEAQIAAQVIIPIEEFDENKFPVIVLYHIDALDSFHRLRRVSEWLDKSPEDRSKEGITLGDERREKIYVAIWSDGRIIWGKLEADIDRGVTPRYIHSFSGLDKNIVYFQSQISTKKVEILVSEINKLDLWQGAAEVFAPFHVGRCYLFVINDNRLSSFIVPDINWPRSGGSGCGITAGKWERAVRLLLFEVIPKQGEKVEITIKQAKLQDKKTGAVRRISFPDVVVDSAR